MLDGVTITESKAQKDELILEGIDVQNVSQSGTLGFTVMVRAQLTNAQTNSRLDSRLMPCKKQGYPKILGRYLRVGQGYRCSGVDGVGFHVLHFILKICMSHVTISYDAYDKFHGLQNLP